MPKLPLALFLLVPFAAVSQIVAQKPSANLRIDVDRDIVYLPCRKGFPAKYRTCPDALSVAISATATGKTIRNRDYEYSVTGGRIVGTGSKVVWDMTAAVPGTYRIILAIGKGKSRLITEKIITVLYCDECTWECLECPQDILAVSKEKVRRGELITISVKSGLGPKYRWRVEGGAITEGQGTNQITVVADTNTSRSTLLIKLEIIDNFCFEVGFCSQPQIEIRIVD